MNRCDTYLENLSSYIDEEMSEESKKAFETHLKECASCTEELEIMQTILSACSELEEDLPDGFEASLHQRLEATKEEAEVSKNRLGKIRLFAQIAAGFVVVITLGFMVRSGLFGSMIQKNAARDMSSTAQAPAAAPAAASGAENNGTSGTAALSMKRAADDEQGQESITMMNDTSLKFEDNIQGKEIEEMAEASEVTDAGQTPDAIRAPIGEPAETTDAPVTPDSDESPITIVFTEDGVGGHKTDGQDTLVRIKTDDVKKAIGSMMIIEEKLAGNENENRKQLANLLDAYEDSYEDPVKQTVEIVLYYSNDELWQKFLNELQAVYPDMDVESVPAKEDREFIRVIVEKVR